MVFCSEYLLSFLLHLLFAREWFSLCFDCFRLSFPSLHSLSMPNVNSAAIKLDALMSLCTHQIHKMDLVVLDRVESSTNSFFAMHKFYVFMMLSYLNSLFSLCIHIRMPQYTVYFLCWDKNQWKNTEFWPRNFNRIKNTRIRYL